ncbi:hypothetical protein TTHERM_000790889 (macronuclear) [Tetrahymena thermophila SB210]|uniref:Uncharacterized protein n=1 Tax=Tetrahymena thermophila (strain SB210) TaxID=312017 RepID=W7X1D4_TETTS|nr:hypothetical protein TTHERM_000790889 [Tetrahymena thermophila SB210]EWS71402.1 hypothetical protein TTHERM_000790889 [Tetrahymena thermophila SB210]|eukprot:XP_012656074.1 hypothetical protein TTHERM_000790889 [Tetrahymena thermophila SB210]
MLPYQSQEMSVSKNQQINQTSKFFLALKP